ncbi:hypothetical protein [Aquimarina longa]|uniref:hypothetical protein n=1 Tax=Aquimarina longa TaxID=1080221 RepID=UPI000785E636|nr:hypothetical protein [Aquimarina longa]
MNSLNHFLENLSYLLGTLFYILPILAFIVLSIYYINKVGNTKEGTFILVGNILILVVAIIHQFLFRFIDNLGVDIYTFINLICNLVAFIGSILFVIGFFMIIKKNIKNDTITFKN